jgi:hypothetical protein
MMSLIQNLIIVSKPVFYSYIPVQTRSALDPRAHYRFIDRRASRGEWGVEAQ